MFHVKRFHTNRLITKFNTTTKKTSIHKSPAKKAQTHSHPIVLASLHDLAGDAWQNGTRRVVADQQTVFVCRSARRRSLPPPPWTLFWIRSTSWWSPRTSTSSWRPWVCQKMAYFCRIRRRRVRRPAFFCNAKERRLPSIRFCFFMLWWKMYRGQFRVLVFCCKL